MFSEKKYIGCVYGVEDLRTLNDGLSARVVDKVNDTQKLVMWNNFARESNEHQFKKCLQERISDILSWRWVFEDLSKRLQEAMETLRYEHNALRVVVERVTDEIDGHSREGSKPGALIPLSDSVEEAILNEFNFLREQKKKFEKIILELDKQTGNLERIKKRIEEDIVNKEQALSVDEAIFDINLNSAKKVHQNEKKKTKKKKSSPLIQWENRCISLKKAGLQALSDAIITRQQVRSARVQLSINAQAYAIKVDYILRKRLHANKLKLEELHWQKDESIRDLKSLDEELMTTEQNVLETMEQVRVIEARLADRTLRPAKELTKDDVNKKLKEELGRLKHFIKDLTKNIDSITCLQTNLTETISRIDCYTEDIIKVVKLDEERIYARLGEEYKCNAEVSASIPSASTSPGAVSQRPSHALPKLSSQLPLTSIKEEEEDEDIDDYPFEF